MTGLGGNTLFRNNGSGTFTDVTRPAGAAVSGWSSSAAFVDYDHDGRLDLYVGRYLAWTWESNPVCPSADGTGRAYCHPKLFAPVSSVLLRNNGEGTFTDASATSGIGAHPGKALGVAIHDYDRDGWIDLFVANDSMQQFLFRNTGNGTFAEVALEAGVAYDDDGRSFAGMGTDVEDYDNDGWPDVIVTTLSMERYALYRALGRGRFDYASHTTGVGRCHPSQLRLGNEVRGLRQRRAPRSVRGAKPRARYGVTQRIRASTISSRRSCCATRAPRLRSGQAPRLSMSRRRSGRHSRQPASGRGAAFADLDDDGDVDIVVANLDAAPTLLRNDGGNASHWLTVSLRGTRSNWNGIGAVVSIVDEHGRTQSGVCSTASSYQSANDRRVHFGLADARTVRRLEVRWPSGTVQVLTDIKVNRILEIIEP